MRQHRLPYGVGSHNCRAHNKAPAFGIRLGYTHPALPEIHHKMEPYPTVRFYLIGGGSRRKLGGRYNAHKRDQRHRPKAQSSGYRCTSPCHIQNRHVGQTPDPTGAVAGRMPPKWGAIV